MNGVFTPRRMAILSPGIAASGTKPTYPLAERQGFRPWVVFLTTWVYSISSCDTRDMVARESSATSISKVQQAERSSERIIMLAWLKMKQSNLRCFDDFVPQELIRVFFHTRFGCRIQGSVSEYRRKRIRGIRLVLRVVGGNSAAMTRC